MMRRQMSILPLLAATTMAAACSDSKGGPTDPGSGIASGSMSFAYSGDLSGSFSAIGAPVAGEEEGRTWAAAIKEASGAMLVYGSRERPGARYDLTSIVAPQAAVGTYTISEDCDDDFCPAVAVVFGLEKGDDADFERSCYLETGTITVQSVAGGRTKGTFSGTGSCFTIDDEEIEIEEIAIASGAFDTALIASVD